MSKYANPSLRGGSHNFVGKPLHSQVVTVESARMIFVSGQVARDADGKVVGEGDMRAQI